jgi:hypothetical protein
MLQDEQEDFQYQGLLREHLGAINSHSTSQIFASTPSTIALDKAFD